MLRLRQRLVGLRRVPQIGRVVKANPKGLWLERTICLPHLVVRRGIASSLLSHAQHAEDIKPEPKEGIDNEADERPEDLLELYREMVAQGKLKWDDNQVACIMKLRHLLNTLSDYSPPLYLLAKLQPSAPYRARRALQQQQQEGRRSWWKGKGRADDMGEGERGRELVRVISGEEELANLKTPKGILITGPPGTGKSLLLSLFFDLLPTPKKKRHHYHAFTLSLYQRVFAEMNRRKQAITETITTQNMEVAAKRGWRAVFAGGRWDGEDGKEVRGWEYTGEETIPFVIAKDMIMEYHILYFDELQLVDASSAALLRDVLSWYWRLGGVIVSCSNRVPDDLYHHGVQKERMMGFLDALKSRCEVVELDGGRDWRRGIDPDAVVPRSSWFEGGDGGFEIAWEKALGGKEANPSSVNVYGRMVPVPAVVGSTCRFTFAELCEQALGPADYISLTSTYKNFFIDKVPILLLKNKNEARRLINLVDALYESRCQVFISAEASPETMFFPDAVTSLSADQDNDTIMAAEALSETLHAPSRPNVSVYNPLPSNKRHGAEKETRGSSFSVLSIFTGEDERFAYKRAVSRLIEMTTSPTYAQETWIPMGKEGRGWEIFSVPETDSGAYTYRKQMPHQAGSDEEFGSEAEYARMRYTPGPSVLDRKSTGPRENAPIIGEQHVWGVADEWGPKTGRWGKGPKAFEEGNHKKKSDDE